MQQADVKSADKLRAVVRWTTKLPQNTFTTSNIAMYSTATVISCGSEFPFQNLDFQGN